MEAMTADLVEWLREQIAEERALALAAARGVAEHNHAPARLDDGEWPDAGLLWESRPFLLGKRLVSVTTYAETVVADRTMRGVSDHMARWDPARVLAECDAKVAILELHTGETEACVDPNWEDDDFYAAPCPTLRLLAAVYSDRPGYRGPHSA